MSPFAKRLMAAMNKAGLCNADIEEKMGLEAGSVEKWLSDPLPPDNETVNKLAEILCVSSNSLLFGVEKLGEMKAMFPNDNTATPSPFGTWQFLVGLMMVFVGIGGALLLFMRTTGIGYEGSIWSAMGTSLAVFGGICLAGLVLCIVGALRKVGVSNKTDNAKKEEKK